jgi:TolB-like protein/tetratricopeptide (TPR) repeat protein
VSRKTRPSGKAPPEQKKGGNQPLRISSAEIHGELQRILASGVFASAARMKRFLRCVVEETLAGRGDQLNEQFLGMEVYDRDERFDPRVDSIVRVDAGRLRSKLREYYSSEGRSSSVLIEIPKGSYKALFSRAKEGDSGRLVSGQAKGRSGGKTIAVLSFADLSPERDQEYFGDGIAEELMFALSRVPGLRVVSQTSVFAFKGKGLDIREIGGQLNVECILEGSVRKSAQKLRIVVQLTDVATGFHIWSEVFTCELRDVFAVQEEISRSVAAALRVTVAGQEPTELPRPRACNVNAFNHYLVGRAFWNKQTESGLRTAISHFENCLAEDASYARAYLGISDCYRKLEFWGLMSPSDALPKATAAAEKALELDSSLIEAKVPLAAIMAVNQWRWAEADAMFREILLAHPDYAPAHQAYAMMCLLPLQRFEEAIEQIQLAEQLDPLALLTNFHVGGAYYFTGRYDEAIQQLEKTLELEPSYHLAHLGLATAFGERGSLDEAISTLEKAKLLAGEIMPIRGALGNIYARAGKMREAEGVLQGLFELQRARYVSPVDFALVYRGLGKIEETFQCLERAAADHCGRLAWSVVDPRFASLRSDPRFLALLKRVFPTQ